MDRSGKLSETEYEIMEVLWNAGEPMSAAQLMTYFSTCRGRQWKAQTLSTFLARLAEKGMISSRREGRVPYYTPLQTPEEYRKKSAQGILDTLYGGYIRNFFAALYGDAPLSAADREELRQWLDEQ